MATAELLKPATEPPAEDRLLLTAADLEHFPEELPSGLFSEIFRE